MARLLNDWLSGYIEFGENTEPPLSYHTWVGLSILSSSLQRKVYMHWSHSKIYPNQYIVLVGPSGTARKGDAMGLGRPFMEHIGLPIASQSITREALIRVMGEGMTSYLDRDGKLRYQAPITIVSAELTVFVGQKNLKLLGDLTDLYDSQDSWTYETKHGYEGKKGSNQTKDSISGVCVNILGATAPDWIPTILPKEAVGGGWTSRVIFVVERGKGKIIANPNLTPPDEVLRDKLNKDLEQIHLITGEYLFDDEALDLYVHWYNNQEQKAKKGIFPITDGRFGGYLARRATHIKKVGMCLSASRGEDLLINARDFRRALNLLELAESKMAMAFKGMGISDIAEVTDKFLTYMIARQECKRSEVVRYMYGDIDSWTLEKVEKLLMQMKVLQVKFLPNEDDAIYTYHTPPPMPR